jgi:hypothetical protein
MVKAVPRGVYKRLGVPVSRRRGSVVGEEFPIIVVGKFSNCDT